MLFKELAKEALEALYADNSVAKIASRYGVSNEMVRRRMIAFDIKRRKLFEPDAEELRALYQGNSMKRLAQHYGVGETVVFKRLKNHGIVLQGFESGGHRKKTGVVFSDLHRANISKALKGVQAGDKNPRWSNGAAQENKRLRASGDYKNWKNSALELAGHACQSCGIKKGSVCGCCGQKAAMHVHHIKSFALYPDSRFDVSNAEVLCSTCHQSRHFGKIA
jgi:hypothetical protein